MTGVLAVTMNDSAARLLDAVSGFAGLCPSEGLAPRLRDRPDRGILHRGNVLVWSGSVGNTVNAPVDLSRPHRLGVRRQLVPPRGLRARIRRYHSAPDGTLNRV
jgi:hypothetical protein